MIDVLVSALFGAALLVPLGLIFQRDKGFLGSLAAFALAPFEWPSRHGSRSEQATAYALTLAVWVVVAVILGGWLRELPPGRD